MSSGTERQQRIRAEARARAYGEARRTLSGGDAENSRRIVLRVLDGELRRLPPADRGPVACTAGCDMCCHLRVMATPVEVFGLLEYLERTLDAVRFAALAARARRARETLDGLPPARLLTTNLACPALEEGRCLGYPARPFNCRSYHSLDRDACQQAFDDPEHAPGHPELAPVARVHAGVQGGFMAALGEAGFDATQVELASAMAEALDDPDARERFRRGGKAFLRTVRVPPA